MNYEALRQIINQPINGYVPSASFRATVLAQSPQLAPILNAYPTGTVPVSSQISQWFDSGQNTQNEDSGLARVDYQWTDRTAISLRFNTDSFSNVALSAPVRDISRTVVSPI